MKKIKLDKAEEGLLQSIENDEWVSIKNKKREINKYNEIARNTLKKDRRINIRISNYDIDAIQVKAIEEGIPYQTLISSVIHKYVSGRLVEKIEGVK